MLGDNLEEFDDAREEAMNLINEYKAASRSDYLDDSNDFSNDY